MSTMTYKSEKTKDSHAHTSPLSADVLFHISVFDYLTKCTEIVTFIFLKHDRKSVENVAVGISKREYRRIHREILAN